MYGNGQLPLIPQQYSHVPLIPVAEPVGAPGEYILTTPWSLQGIGINGTRATTMSFRRRPESLQMNRYFILFFCLDKKGHKDQEP
jgi:hypothetical protein